MHEKEIILAQSEWLLEWDQHYRYDDYLKGKTIWLHYAVGTILMA